MQLGQPNKAISERQQRFDLPGFFGPLISWEWRGPCGVGWTAV